MYTVTIHIYVCNRIAGCPNPYNFLFLDYTEIHTLNFLLNFPAVTSFCNIIVLMLIHAVKITANIK